MIAAWILYAIVVGSLIGGSGLALEKFLGTHGFPSRWVWVGAILLSVIWPLGHWVWESHPQRVPVVEATSLPSVESSAPSSVVLPLDPITVEIPPESVLRLRDGPILVGWALASSLLLLFFAALFLRTRHLASEWRRGRAGGQQVLFSDDWGPAVVGFIRPRIVLPAWCEELDERALRFILDHELEHVRAGDLRLMILTGILPILFPFHLPLWWQLARLRTAVEADCDRRVLGKNPGQTRPYMNLLLDIGERSSSYRPIAAMISEPYETLKRRIRIMTMPLPKRPWLKGGFLAGVGVLLTAVACWAPGPTDAQSDDLGSPAETVSPKVGGELQEGARLPVFTPFSVNPSIRNPEEVVAALRRGYPADLRDQGLGGTVHVWFFLDEETRVQRTMVNGSSGHRALDNAALMAADIIEFTPALNRDRSVPVWVSLPIEFTTSDEVPERDTSVEEPRVRAAPPSSNTGALAGGNTGSIAGTARDASTDQPLAFVQLLISGTGRGTLSNQEGRFLIEHVPVGDHLIWADLMGFAEVTEEVSVGTNGRAEVEFVLQPQAIGLEALVVKGT